MMSSFLAVKLQSFGKLQVYALLISVLMGPPSLPPSLYFHFQSIWREKLTKDVWTRMFIVALFGTVNDEKQSECSVAGGGLSQPGKPRTYRELFCRHF